jgi:hypothetical protein
LVGKSLVFVLHFLLVQLGQLSHLLVLPLLPAQVVGKVRDACDEQDDENDYRNDYLFLHR